MIASLLVIVEEQIISYDEAVVVSFDDGVSDLGLIEIMVVNILKPS